MIPRIEKSAKTRTSPQTRDFRIGRKVLIRPHAKSFKKSPQQSAKVRKSRKIRKIRKIPILADVFADFAQPATGLMLRYFFLKRWHAKSPNSPQKSAEGRRSPQKSAEVRGIPRNFAKLRSGRANGWTRVFLRLCRNSWRRHFSTCTCTFTFTLGSCVCVCTHRFLCQSPPKSFGASRPAA